MAEDVAQLPVQEQLDISTEENQAPATMEVEDKAPVMVVEDQEEIREPAGNLSNNAETGNFLNTRDTWNNNKCSVS